MTWSRQIATDSHQHFVMYENFGLFKRVVSVYDHNAPTFSAWFVRDKSAWRCYNHHKMFIEFVERSWK